MGGKVFFCPFCALEYFIRITKQWYNKRKETKKNSKFPKIVRVKWWDSTSSDHSVTTVRLANSKARIKPTASLSVFDKKNSIEFLLDFLHYLYKWLTLTLYQSPVLPYESLLSHTSINKKIKEKKKKRILNNDLAVLPSYNNYSSLL